MDTESSTINEPTEKNESIEDLTWNEWTIKQKEDQLKKTLEKMGLSHFPIDEILKELDYLYQNTDYTMAEFESAIYESIDRLEDVPVEEESTSPVSKKEEYLAKLAQTESKELALEYQNDFQILQDLGYNYEIWDDLLNEVYGVLKTQLTDTEMSKLKEEQLAWIDYKESEAEKAFNESGGGSWSRVAHSEVFLNLTKERCYELVENYMK